MRCICNIGHAVILNLLGMSWKKGMKDLMQSIRRYSKIEGLLWAKDEELELGKGVAAECENLKAKVLYLRAELEKNSTRVANLSVYWTEKVVELERKMAELERDERACVATLARVVTLEDTIHIRKFE